MLLRSGQDALAPSKLSFIFFIMSTNRRVHQVAERIKTLIAAELVRAADPRFLLVTITSASVTDDLRLARVYWIVSGDQGRREEIDEAFRGAAGLFKRILGKELRTRFVPDLTFYYDDTFDAVTQVDDLFAKIKRRDIELGKIEETEKAGENEQ